MRPRRGYPHPHLVMVDERKKRVTGQMTVRCAACDDEFTVLLPCSMLMPGAILRQWEKEHGPCAKIRDRFRAELLGVLKERAWCMQLARALLEAQGAAR